MNSLQKNRVVIEDIDTKMKELFIKRMKAAIEIANYKKENKLPVFDKNREAELIKKNTQGIGEELKEYYCDFLNQVLRISKKVQTDKME